MRPLHVEDLLEFTHLDFRVHPAGQYLVDTIDGHSQDTLRRDLVLFPFLVPFCLGDRWSNTSDQIPFDDTETGLCQSGKTTDDENTKDEGGATEQPVGQGFGDGSLRGS